MTKIISIGIIVFVVAVLGALPSPGFSAKTIGVLETTLPVDLKDIGAKLVEMGVIDPNKMEVMRQNLGEKVVMTKDNAHYLLNLLWAFGLANKNPILEDKTEMMNPDYGGAGNFASTGGWTLAKSPSGSGQANAMDHYDKHILVKLTPEQQKLVDRTSRNIYRPCCGNSTHFPDCNHGMAMLGLLELMASQGVGEQDMYKAALTVNSYWFPNDPTINKNCNA